MTVGLLGSGRMPSAYLRLLPPVLLMLQQKVFCKADSLGAGLWAALSHPALHFPWQDSQELLQDQLLQDLFLGTFLGLQPPTTKTVELVAHHTGPLNLLVAELPEVLASHICVLTQDGVCVSFPESLATASLAETRASSHLKASWVFLCHFLFLLLQNSLPMGTQG